MKDMPPGVDLHAQVRGGFVKQRTSLHRWCAENGVRRTAADKTLKGEWNGPKAKAMRQQLLRAAKVTP